MLHVFSFSHWMLHMLHGSVYLQHTTSTAQTIGGTDATVWEIRCALSHSAAETSSRLRQKSPQDLQTYFSCRKRRQLFVNVLYNLGVISVGIHIWVIHLHCPRDFREGTGKRGLSNPMLPDSRQCTIIVSSSIYPQKLKAFPVIKNWRRELIRRNGNFQWNL